jgi:phosphoserine phosphatase
MNQRKIALFDIDKTVYDGYVILPLAEYFFEKSIIKKEVVDSLFQVLHLYKSKQVDYEASCENFNAYLASGLRNHSPDSIMNLTKAFLETQKGNKFFPFAKPLIELLKETHDIYFVTGEVQCVGKAVADFFCVSGYLSSEMEVIKGEFTGNISRSLTNREGKRDAIEHLFNAHPYKNSLGFGDSEGDIELLDKVMYSFCINATEELQKVAISKGWSIVSPLSIIETVENILQIHQ